MTRPLIVCPFCPLHCDDIDPSMLVQGKVSCRLANSRMHAITQVSPAADNLSDLDECREWIRTAKRIRLSGDVIDWETSRAVSEFIATTGADTDGLGSDEAYTETFSREGAFLTTLGELTARDATLLVIGDPAIDWPRIDEKLAMVTRRVVWSGSAKLPRKLATLRRKLSSAHFEVADDDVRQAYELIQASQYFVVVVSPSSIQEQAMTTVHRHVIWSTLLGMIRELNRNIRATILNFDRSLTVRSVLASRGTSSMTRLPSDEETVCIRLSPFGEQGNRTQLRTIVIGSHDSLRSSTVKWLPASVPGIHHPGIVIRGDGSVTLPLHATDLSTTLPTPASQLRALILLPT